MPPRLIADVPHEGDVVEHCRGGLILLSVQGKVQPGELHALDSELKFHFQRNGKSISEKAVRKLRFEDLLDVCVFIEWVHEDQLGGKTVDDDG